MNRVGAEIFENTKNGGGAVLLKKGVRYKIFFKENLFSEL